MIPTSPNSKFFYSPEPHSAVPKNSLKKETVEKLEQIINDFAIKAENREEIDPGLHSFAKLISSLKSHPDNLLLVSELQKIEKKHNACKAPRQQKKRPSLVFSSGQDGIRYALPAMLDTASGSKYPPVGLQIAFLIDNRPKGAVASLASHISQLFSEAAEANPRVAKLLNETVEKI